MWANKVGKGTAKGSRSLGHCFWWKSFWHLRKDERKIGREKCLINFLETNKCPKRMLYVQSPLSKSTPSLNVSLFHLNSCISIHESFFFLIWGKLTTFFILNSAWHLLSLMHLPLEAAQCSQSSPFSHRAAHQNNGGVKVPYSRTSVAMVVEDEESVLDLIPNSKPPSMVGIWVYVSICRFYRKILQILWHSFKFYYAIIFDWFSVTITQYLLMPQSLCVGSMTY